VSIWFDRNDADLIAYENYNDTFGEEEWSLLLLETDSIYSPAFLRDLEQITDSLAELEDVIKITSITNLRDNFVSDDELLDYRQLYSDLVLQDSAALKRFREQLEGNPIFERNLILHDNERFTIVLIQNANRINDKSAYRIELIDSIYGILDRYQSIENYALAGTTVVNAELNRAATRDVIVFYSLVTVLLTAIALLMLRSIRDLAVMYAVVASSALPTMGLLAALNIPFNMITVMLPTILIALSVAGVVHIITEFHHTRTNRDSEQALHSTIIRLWKPTLWTTLTTMVGFGVFTISNVYPVFQLGAFAVLGLSLACFANLVIAPILLLGLWAKGPDSAVRTRQSKSFLFSCSENISNSVLLVILLIMMLPIYGLTRLEVDTNYIRFFSSSHPATQSYDLIRRSGFAQNPIAIHLQYDADKPYSYESSLQGTLALESMIKQLPEVIKVMSGSDFLIEIDLAFNGDNGQSLDLYSKPQIDQLLLLGELSGNDDIGDLVAGDLMDVQIIAMTNYMSSRELNIFKEKIHHLKEMSLPDEVTMQITGTTVLWANMDTQVSTTQFLTLLLLGGFLAIFLPLIFGSFRLGIVGMLVNIIPLAVTLGCMSLLGLKINIATALIGGISLGVVVDDTIHFITRIIQNKRKGYSTAESVDEARQSIGKSIVRTTLILVVGFSCMATSNFLPTAHFGIFISLSIALALFLDLICLPVLLKTFPWLTQNQVVEASSKSSENSSIDSGNLVTPKQVD